MNLEKVKKLATNVAGEATRLIFLATKRISESRFTEAPWRKAFGLAGIVAAVTFLGLLVTLCVACAILFGVAGLNAGLAITFVVTIAVFIIEARKQHYFLTCRSEAVERNTEG